jgi:hypothetical protein
MVLSLAGRLLSRQAAIGSMKINNIAGVPYFGGRDTRRGASARRIACSLTPDLWRSNDSDLFEISFTIVRRTVSQPKHLGSRDLSFEGLNSNGTLECGCVPLLREADFIP